MSETKEAKPKKSSPWWKRVALTAVLVAGGIAATAVGQPVIGAALVSAAIGREVLPANGNGKGK